MQRNQIEDLLARYNTGNVSDEEKALVETWYLKYKNSASDISFQQLEEDQKESIDLLLSQIGTKPARSLWPRAIAAASVILCLGIGAYLLNNKRPAKRYAEVTQTQTPKQDIAPGGNKAILTLAGGKQIVLTGAQNGQLANQGNTLITKTAYGNISYTANKQTTGTETVYNTMATPRSGQYQLTLADGTKVWLNAASSIKYPVAFNGNERRVEVTGEVYFEVAHNRKKPFRVQSNGQTVEVLGTHFNINTYGDDGLVKTTLLEGSVKVSSTTQSITIKPGEQARIKNNAISVATVDVDEVIAWKNGFFNFKDANIQMVMKQMARWYDVDVKYEGQVSQREFSGEISRNINASQIMDILSFKKIHYKIEGKTVTIMP